MQAWTTRLTLFAFALNVATFAADIEATRDSRASQREAVLALGELTAPPAWRAAKERTDQPGLDAVFFDALPYRGNPTKVFGWLGLPEGATGRVPGVVLVHGGGGTAFPEWVRLWRDRGFAALSIAVEGQSDQRVAAAKDQDNPSGWRRHEWAGPRRRGIYGDSAEPLRDQWMYHAVADTILANSLLRSLPEVDAEKVGLMGISWGGVITSTVIGIDDRFAFAIPTYGCGSLSDAGNQYGRALGNDMLYQHVWDPMVRLHRATMPTLWLSWPGDKHFPLDAQAACYRATPGPHMVALIPGMRHGHGAGWRPPDSYAFAESVVSTSAPWCRYTDLKEAGDRVRVRFQATESIDEALLISTADQGFTGQRQWRNTPVEFEQAQGVITVEVRLPPETTAWFVNLNSSGLTASSDFFESEKRL